MMIFSLVAMTGLEKCCITSAYLQWLCHSGEQPMAHGPLVFVSGAPRNRFSDRLRLIENLPNLAHHIREQFKQNHELNTQLTVLGELLQISKKENKELEVSLLLSFKGDRMPLVDFLPFFTLLYKSAPPSVVALALASVFINVKVLKVLYLLDA